MPFSHPLIKALANAGAAVALTAALGACGSSANPLLGLASEQRSSLLIDLSRARSGASAHDAAQIDRALSAFQTEVRKLQASGALSQARASELLAEAAAAAAEARAQLSGTRTSTTQSPHTITTPQPSTRTDTAAPVTAATTATQSAPVTPAAAPSAPAHHAGRHALTPPGHAKHGPGPGPGAGGGPPPGPTQPGGDGPGGPGKGKGPKGA